MKQNLIFLFVVFSTFTNLIGQNPGLIFAPNYLNDNNLQPLPIPLNLNESDDLLEPIIPNDPTIPYDGYDGRPALASSNIIMREDEQIVFFYIDGVIYNKRGIAKGTMPNYALRDYTEIDAGGNTVYGGNEVLIVPHPGNCDQFYIFDTDIDANGFGGAYPYIVLYDAAKEEIIKTILWWRPSGSTVPDFLFDFDSQHSHSWWEINTNKYSNATYSATNKQADGSYYVVAFFNREIFTLKVDANGLSTPYQFYHPNNPTETNNRALSELFEDPLTHEKTFVFHTNSFSNKIIIEKFDASMQTLISEVVVDLGFELSFVHGLEFSPNGRYLYFTHTTTSQNPGQLAYIDLLNPTNYTTITVPPTYDLQNSEIEIRKEANNVPFFVIAYSGGLLKLTNPDDPETGVFSSYSSFSNSPSYATVNPYSTLENKLKYYCIQDQIDNLDYQDEINTGFDHDVFEAEISATWSPNTSTQLYNNPVLYEQVGNTVYIKDELRIPAGKTITIKNMIFKFAPDAKVVVEKGATGLNGGKLILDNTTFTVDTRCIDDMWKGVEVQGIATENQSLTSTKQGTFLVQNGSRVEFAYVGAKSTDGGIIYVTRSTFSNNHNSIQINAYTAPDLTNNKCKIEFSDLIWDNELKNRAILTSSLPPPFHILISSTDGVYITDNNFSNNISDANGFLNRGGGVFGQGSIFSVISSCDDFFSPNTCPSIQKNSFRNLDFGVQAINPNRKPFTVDFAEMYNCRYGVISVYSSNPRITRNLIKVRELGPSISSSTQTYGIVLQNSTGYMIEENYISKFDDPAIPLSSANTYGVVIRNSGEGDNIIYKNLFDNLKIGSQAEGTNAKLDVPLTNNYARIGLKWKCNRFLNNIYQHDLIVVDGIVDYQQGYLSSSDIASKVAANNQFSLDNEGNEHDFRLENSKDLQYVYLNGLRQKPDAYTYVAGSGSSVLPVAQGDGSITYNATDCPSNFTIPGPTPRERRLTLGTLVTALTQKLENGDTEALLEAIRTYTNLDELKPILLEHSPYLSDRMLNALMDRKPNSTYLKDILIANSSLTSPIKDRVNGMNLPNGTKQQIALAQKGLNPRESLLGEISYYKSEISNLSNRIIYELQEETYQETELIKELESSMRLADKKHLLEIYTKNNQTEKINPLVADLTARGVSQDYLKIVEIRKEMLPYATIQEAFNALTDLATNLNNLALNSLDEEVREMAQSLLDLNEYKTVIKPFKEVEPRRSGSVVPENEETMINYSSTLATIYPNPTTGQFYIDLPNEDKGNLKVEIFDVTGKFVYFNEFEQTNVGSIELKDVVKGMYLVKITLDNKLVEIQKLELK